MAPTVAATTYMGGMGCVTGASFSYCSNTGDICAYNTSSASINVGAMNATVTKCSNCLIKGNIQRKGDATPIAITAENILTYAFQKATTADKVVDCYCEGDFIPEPTQE